MKPLVLIVPAAILAGGIATFLLAPGSVAIRSAILASDTVAAAVVGFLLWRRAP
jgi:hypothetical protein